MNDANLAKGPPTIDFSSKRARSTRADSKPESSQDPYKSVVQSVVGKALASKISEKTYGKMTPSEITSARMTKASYINLREGSLSSQAFTHAYLKDWKLDNELSNEHGSVFQHKRTSDVRIAYRGTQNLADWDTNIRMATGIEGGEQFQALETQMDRVIEKYGKSPSILSGHSKGGGQAIVMGEKYGISTHTQDPFIPTKQLIGGKTNAKHSVVRTPTDWVSAGSNISKFRQGFTQTDIQAVGTSILESHDLKLMTGVGHKGTGNSTYNPELKNKAFLLSEIQAGSSFFEIAEKVGLSRGTTDYYNLRSEIETMRSTPNEIVQSSLEDAGYVPKATVGPVVGSASRIGGKLTSLIGETTVKVVNARTVAGIVGGVGTVAALKAMGVDDEETLAVASGAVGNASADTAGAAMRAVSRGVVETGAEAVVGEGLILSEAAAIGAESLARGGAAGVLGYGVEKAVTAIGAELGVDDTVTGIAAAASGGAAAGAVFGPEGALLGAMIGAGVEGVTAIWQAAQPKNDYLLQPFRNDGFDAAIGSNPEIQSIISRFNQTADFSVESIKRTEDQVTEKVLVLQAKHGGWGHGYNNYTASLKAMPRGSHAHNRDDNGLTVMLRGDYSVVTAQENAVHAANDLERNKESTAWYDNHPGQFRYWNRPTYDLDGNKVGIINERKGRMVNKDIQPLVDSPKPQRDTPAAAYPPNPAFTQAHLQISQTVLPQNHELIHFVMAS